MRIALAVALLFATDLTELVKKVKPGVVYLAALDVSGNDFGNGSGFFLTADGIVVTNKHVVDSGGQLVATRPDGTQHKVLGVVALHPTRDLALVKVEGSGFTTLELGESESLVEGTPLTMIGNPAGLSFTVADGLLAAIRPKGWSKDKEEDALPARYDQGKLLQLDLSSAAGASGSPVVNRNGQVIGVMSSGMGFAGHMNFAVPVEAVRELLPKVNDPPQPLGVITVTDLSLTSKYRNLAVSGAIFAVLIGAVVFSRLRKRPRY